MEELMYRCDKCGEIKGKDEIDIRTVEVYKCKDKSIPEEPGDVMRTYWVCKGGCEDG